ncbi:hypothetical protein BV25DRAFT_1839659 [Artomyces pyxidatus]|uniref:Uncharacterized protein n=1 Tax=Artomyces pyxidatus TaxID=48021 RepID=A0ACB8SV76_9AGAM|nr:hypothetical protein BV25DRAFT_1839659 [Artomyces pyxidatus]
MTFVGKTRHRRGSSVSLKSIAPAVPRGAANPSPGPSSSSKSIVSTTSSLFLSPPPEAPIPRRRAVSQRRAELSHTSGLRSHSPTGAVAVAEFINTTPDDARRLREPARAGPRKRKAGEMEEREQESGSSTSAHREEDPDAKRRYEKKMKSRDYRDMNANAIEDFLDILPPSEQRVGVDYVKRLMAEREGLLETNRQQAQEIERLEREVLAAKNRSQAEEIERLKRELVGTGRRVSSPTEERTHFADGQGKPAHRTRATSQERTEGTKHGEHPGEEREPTASVAEEGI